MRAGLLTLLVVAIAVGVSGSAHAGSHADLGLARAEIDDQRSNECWSAPVQICQVSASNTSDPGNATIDASQNITYVGAGVSVDRIFPVGVDYEIYGRDGYVPNPILPFVGKEWSNSSLGPGVPGVFDLRFDGVNQTIWLDYNWVNVSNPYDPIYWKEIGQTFPDGQGHAGYNQIGPFNESMGDTDTLLQPPPDVLCTGPLQVRECYDAASTWNSWQANNTPDVRFGAAFNEAEAASNASKIGNRTYNASTSNESFGTWPSHSPSSVPLPVDNETMPHPTLHRLPVDQDQNVSLLRPSGHKPPPGKVVLQTVQAPNARPSQVLKAIVAGGLGVFVAGLLFLYARIRSRKEAVASAMRCKLHELIAKTPGISPSALAGEVGLSRNGLVHHLRVMERTQMILVRSEGKKVSLFTRQREVDPLAALIARGDAASAILRALQPRPDGLTKPELVAATPSLPTRTRDHAVRQLVARQILRTVDADGRRYRIAAAP